MVLRDLIIYDRVGRADEQLDSGRDASGHRADILDISHLSQHDFIA